MEGNKLEQKNQINDPISAYLCKIETQPPNPQTFEGKLELISLG